MCFEQSMAVPTLKLQSACLLSSEPGEEDVKKKMRCSSKQEAARCQLVDYHTLPHFLKHNEYILRYYRSEWPLKQTILSVFAIHNETINIWTHLIGFLLFLALTTYTAMLVPTEASMPSPTLQDSVGIHLHLAGSSDSILDMSQYTTVLHNESLILQPLELNQTNVWSSTEAVQQVVSRWPFYAYLCGAMFCLLMSCSCHLLSCHSEHTSYVMLRLDYAGISALIVTSFYPLVYYSFACDPFFQNLYISFITLFGIATVLVSLVPVFETPEFRFVRAGLFACMGVSGLVPIVHKMVAFGHRQEAMLTTEYETVMGMCYGIGVAVYALRIPERWMPGKFDLAGHSHQLFHVLVIAGAYTHYLAAMVYLRWREQDGC